MNVDEAIQLARSNHRAVLATHRRDGGVQMSPVMVAVDDERRLVVSSRETAIKTHNLRRDPRAAICVIPDSFFANPWATIEGRVEVLSLPDAMEPLVGYYRQVAGEHPDWDEYRAAMTGEQRVLLRLTAERAGPSRSG